MIDIADIRKRWRKAVAFLDERGRRVFAANEALAQGSGGVTATSIATGLARSTIDRGIQELRSARNDLGTRLRRPGAGRKSAATQQPELPAALEKLIEDAIRGDPMSPLRWVSRSQRHLVRELTAQGFKVSQRVVGKLLRELHYSCQANRKTREGNNPTFATRFRKSANRAVFRGFAWQGRHHRRCDHGAPATSAEAIRGGGCAGKSIFRRRSKSNWSGSGSV